MKETFTSLQKFFTRFSFRGIIAMVVVLGSFGFLFMIARLPVPEGNKESVNVAQGFVLGVLATVVGWYFGSSKEKSDQDRATTIIAAQEEEGTTSTEVTTKTTRGRK